MKNIKVYILLTNTGTIFTNIIKLFTKKPYNHASISLDRELTEVYSFGRKTVRNPFIGGFVRENVTKGLFIQADCAIYSLTITETQFEKIKQCVKQMESEKENYRYNFVGLLGFIINKPIKRKRAFFCSQFVATVLSKSDTIRFEKPTELIAPNDFEELQSVQLEYEGTVKEYVNGSVEANFSMPLAVS